MAHDVTYRDLADGLEEQLSDVPAGSRVPSEHELAAEHGISRPTARAALQELERRFLVRRIKGVGTFTHRRIDYVLSTDRPPSVTTTLLAAGVEPSIALVGVRTRRAGADAARRLDIPARDSVTEVVRTTSVESVPASSTTALLPTEVVPGLANHLADEVSMFEVLRASYGLDPVRVWSRASLEVPDPDVAVALALDHRPPTWCLESVNRDRRSGRVIEYTRSWMRADVFNVVVELGSDEADR